MTWWMWCLNIAGLAVLVYLFYKADKAWSSRPLLLAPLLIYVLISVEDLLEWIDLTAVFHGPGGLRATIVLFSLGSVVFYVLYIFKKISESAHQEVRLRTVVERISMAAVMCVLFFAVVYTSIYKLFGNSSFSGSPIGDDLLSQGVAFLYFSVATFVMVGYGDIVAVDNTARLVVIMQMAFSFVTVGYALSMLGTLRLMMSPGSDEELETRGEDQVNKRAEEESESGNEKKSSSEEHS
ncbi:potassium channel family protein [Paenibacillus campinasensis]|uniref:Ion transporter n=1 Tax=Paenibacillus campinasensis TaxID=66347 RepID=A0A268EY19_9BACL|nr:potassium channel family protein [Paenibacillus campinasensis]PAD77974.1 ion transporter [Paenibacillus campinasensis]